ncbi:MAG: arginase family protein, partial [Mycetocola sp.]
LAQRTEPIVTVGGGAAAALGSIEHVAARHQRPLVIIFSPRPGLAPASGNVSADEAFVALLRGQADALLAPHTALDADQIVLVGAREDRPDSTAESGVTRVAELTSLTETIRALASRDGITDSYILVDLPIIDPREISAGDFVPFGLSTTEVTGAIAEIATILPVRGAALTGFAPGTDEDITNSMSPILRIIGALSRALGPA